jgi:hypothetical protein
MQTQSRLVEGNEVILNALAIKLGAAVTAAPFEKLQQLSEMPSLGVGLKASGLIVASSKLL